MQEEELLLTRQDRDRLKVLHQVRKGHIRQREAAEQLQIGRALRELGTAPAGGHRNFLLCVDNS